jgi:hypothetical protein
MAEVTDLNAFNRRFRKILDLPKFEEINARLARGESIEHVARVIQSEMGYCTKIKSETLVRLLREYRHQVLGIVLSPDDPRANNLRAMMEPHLKEQVDIFERYVWLVNVQTERVARAVQNETQMPMLLPTIGMAIEQLRGTLKEFTEYQLQTGLIAREPVKHEVDIKSLDYGTLLAVEAQRRDRFRKATSRLIESIRGNTDEPEEPEDDEPETVQ